MGYRFLLDREVCTPADVDFGDDWEDFFDAVSTRCHPHQLRRGAWWGWWRERMKLTRWFPVAGREVADRFRNGGDPGSFG